jgi:peroxiredoxin family protein
MDETISIVLFSGTDDKLQSAAVLVGGAAALGKPVKILLQYWALEAFRADRIKANHGLAPEAGEAGRTAIDAAAKGGGAHWSDTMRMAKEIGEIDIQACSLSMDVLKLKQADLDSLVDGIEGVAAFLINAGDGQIVFI